MTHFSWFEIHELSLSPLQLSEHLSGLFLALVLSNQRVTDGTAWAGWALLFLRLVGCKVVASVFSSKVALLNHWCSFPCARIVCVIAKKNIGFVACIAFPFSLSPHLRLLVLVKKLQTPTKEFPNKISSLDCAFSYCASRSKAESPSTLSGRTGRENRGPQCLGTLRRCLSCPPPRPFPGSAAWYCFGNRFLGSSRIVLLPKFHKQAEGSPLSFRWSVPGLRVPPHTK